VTAEQSAFGAFEAAAWDRIPAPYERFFGPLTARAIDPLLAAVRIVPGMRLLDVACGPGHVAGRAVTRGARVTGIDVAPTMARIAAASYPDAHFEVAAAEALPYAAASFDAAVCAFGVGHFAEPAEVARELARVVAPGGRVALAWWDEPARARVLGVFADALACAGASPPAELPSGPPFFRYSSEPALVQLLAGAGLQPEPIEQVAFTHRLSGPQALWDGVIAGSVRTSAAIVGQPPDVQRRIRRAFDALVAPYVTDQGLEIPVGLIIAAAGRA
jgi:SAM-dependent methyltransferase